MTSQPPITNLKLRIHVYLSFLESPQISLDFQRLLNPQMLRTTEVHVNELYSAGYSI